MFINIYDEETRGLIRKTNGTETLYFFVLNCLRNQPDLSFSEQQFPLLFLHSSYIRQDWMGREIYGEAKPKKIRSKKLRIMRDGLIN